MDSDRRNHDGQQGPHTRCLPMYFAVGLSFQCPSWYHHKQDLCLNDSYFEATFICSESYSPPFTQSTRCITQEQHTLSNHDGYDDNRPQQVSHHHLA
jgi:hypothetical protein